MQTITSLRANIATCLKLLSFKQRVLKINILRYDKFHSSGFTQRLTKGCVHETAGKLICFIITKRYRNSC